MTWANQSRFEIRFDWGQQGVHRLAVESAAVVIVDVLRFTSAVETACAAGVVVYPWRWKDASALTFAASVGADLAGQSEGPSLSPLLLSVLPKGSKIVLPSPNGATCSLIAFEAGKRVVAGCLRNASAVSSFVNQLPRPIAVIACGEVWSDGSLRPSVEDLLGAGAILSQLHGARSPEANSGVGAFLAASTNLGDAIKNSASGRELCEMGRAEDVNWCAQFNVSDVVPMMEDGAFRAVPRDA